VTTKPRGGPLCHELLASANLQHFCDTTNTHATFDDDTPVQGPKGRAT
jgi:hypothetical protein